MFSEQLEQEKGRNSANVQMLQVQYHCCCEGTASQAYYPQEAFSLLAYSDPWTSPVGGQLDPVGREPVCAQLNSAILGRRVTVFQHAANVYSMFSESKNLPGRPPLEVCVAHTSQLLKLMSHSALGAAAFASMESLLN